jgi:ATP-dependent Lhr-like helicase
VVISGLIARRFTGEENPGGRCCSTDLIYDVLRASAGSRAAARARRCRDRPARSRRLGDMLPRIKGRIVHKELDKVSPLAVPVMLEIGRESVLWRSIRRVAGGSRRRTRQRGDVVE